MIKMKPFNNREEAALQLVDRLQSYRESDGVILGVPRGGVPMAALIAKSLNWPLDILLIKKIGHPGNPEYAIGAVGLYDTYVIPHDDVSDDYVTKETERLRQRLYEMQRLFLKRRPSMTLTGKTVIIVDDGIATGNTLLTGIQLIKKSHPEKIIIAVPVASSRAIDKLKSACDEIVCLLTSDDFGGIGSFYEDFSQVEDSKVIACMDDFYKKS